VNSSSSDVFPAIAPDERYLIFSSAREGGFFQRHQYDFELYISFKNNDGSWTPARNLGEEINAYSPLNPSISPDGKYLFFYSDIEKEFFWVSTKIIDQLH
ncbi:MAG: PD40 domain-containing protein, partial [Bacteroidales bacterium]